MVNISELDRNLSQKELNNLVGGGFLGWLGTEAVKMTGRYLGGQVAEKVFDQGGSAADGTLTGAVTNPSGNFEIDDSVNLTPFSGS